MLPAGHRQPSTPEAEAFVRFCYQRRRVGWPELYDEMCAVATRGLFRGMGSRRAGGDRRRVQPVRDAPPGGAGHRIAARSRRRGGRPGRGDRGGASPRRRPSAVDAAARGTLASAA